MSGQQDKNDKQDKRPADELTTDETMKRLFPPEVADAAKRTALKARKPQYQPPK